MKSRFSLLLLSSVFAIPVFSQTSLAPANKLAAFWSFNETSDSLLIDSSDNGNTGYILSGARVSGVKGKALSFNGTSDYAHVPNAASLNIAGTLTIECWVNVRQINPVSGSGQTFIRKEKAYSLGIGAGGKVGFQVCVGGHWYGSWTLSQQSIQPSQWYHIAGVWNGKTMKTYINGIQDANTYTANGSINSGTYPVYLGIFYESRYERLNGILDEVKVYNDTLSADSILTHYNPNRPQPPAVLIPCMPDPTYNQRPVFSWKKTTPVPMYRFQIAANRQFTTPIISLPTEDTTYMPTVNLPFGAIYWRVGNKADTTLWSSVSSLYIQDSLVPILIPFLPDPTRIRKPRLTWWSVKNADAYSIRLFALPDSTTPFITDALSDTFYVPMVNLPAATFFWRVKSDLNAAYSVPDTFVIASDSIPLIHPMAPDTQQTRRPTFSWSSAEGAAHYSIQIDTVGAFASPYISILVADTFYSPAINLPTGRIVWRVSSSTDPSKYSAVDTFWISATSLIGAPGQKGMNDPAVFFSRRDRGMNISYSINKPSTVSLIVFNMAGTRVSTLHQKVTNPGMHTVFWNQRNGNGRALPTGSYVLSFKINERSFTKKVALLQ
jgi:hypothetical protein